jgi:hypothetical protein
LGDVSGLSEHDELFVRRDHDGELCHRVHEWFGRIALATQIAGDG